MARLACPLEGPSAARKKTCPPRAAAAEFTPPPGALARSPAWVCVAACDAAPRPFHAPRRGVEGWADTLPRVAVIRRCPNLGWERVSRHPPLPCADPSMPHFGASKGVGIPSFGCPRPSRGYRRGSGGCPRPLLGYRRSSGGCPIPFSVGLRAREARHRSSGPRCPPYGGRAGVMGLRGCGGGRGPGAQVAAEPVDGAVGGVVEGAGLPEEVVGAGHAVPILGALQQVVGLV